MQSRATSIRSGIPNAIFRQAQQAPGGLTSAFQSPQLFANYTGKIYVRCLTKLPRTSPDSFRPSLQTQHLSLATKSNYFLPQNSTVSAVLTQLEPRLYIEYVFFFAPVEPVCQLPQLQTPRGACPLRDLSAGIRLHFLPPLVAFPRAALHIPRTPSRLHWLRCGAHVAFGFWGAADAI